MNFEIFTWSSRHQQPVYTLINLPNGPNRDGAPDSPDRQKSPNSRRQLTKIQLRPINLHLFHHLAQLDLAFIVLLPAKMNQNRIAIKENVCNVLPIIIVAMAWKCATMVFASHSIPHNAYFNKFYLPRM